MTPNIVKSPHDPVPHIPVIDEILDAAAFAFGVSPVDISGGLRVKAVAEARMCAYLVARRCTRCGLEELGAAIGRRHHTTILAGIRSAERIAARDTWFAATVETLCARFGEQKVVAAE